MEKRLLAFVDGYVEGVRGYIEKMNDGEYKLSAAIQRWSLAAASGLTTITADEEFFKIHIEG